MIQPEYVSLNALLQYKLFRVPDYQRAYSWKTRQRRDLFEDISKINSKTDEDRDHFLATIVLLKTKEKEESGPDEYSVYDIVDGQQRLTTLIILLKAIAKALLEGGPNERRYGEDLNDLLVKRENNQLILLQTNHDSAHDFRRYLTENTIPQEMDIKTSAQLEMTRAINECEAFVANWTPGATSLLKLINNRLGFVNYVLNDQASAYTIFEVLNSRGLPVESLDKCKSMLMAISYEASDGSPVVELQNQIHEVWKTIYTEIGIDDISGSDILRFSAALLSKRSQRNLMSDDDALSAIREAYASSPAEIINCVDFFLRVARSLKKLNAANNLKAVSRIRQSRFLYIAIDLAKHLTRSDREEIVRLWERVTFLIYGIFRRDARYEVGELVDLGYRIINEKLKKNEIADRLSQVGQKHDPQSVEGQLMAEDCYTQWKEELRYFFFKYEEYLAGQANLPLTKENWERIWTNTAAKSIEHILPQTVGSTDWEQEFGTQDVVDLHVHRLGNLLLVPPEINSKLSNHSFERKKDLYAECSYLRSVREVCKLDKWNKEKLDNRELALIAWAGNYWGFKASI